MSEIVDTNNRTPQESAERLANALDDQTSALKRLTRRSRWMTVMIFILALTLVAVVKFNYDGTMDRCRAGNELRAEENAKWQSIADFLERGATVDGGTLSPSEEEFRDLLSADLEPRDCGDINWLGK